MWQLISDSRQQSPSTSFGSSPLMPTFPMRLFAHDFRASSLIKLPCDGAWPYCAIRSSICGRYCALPEHIHAIARNATLLKTESEGRNTAMSDFLTSDELQQRPVHPVAQSVLDAAAANLDLLAGLNAVDNQRIAVQGCDMAAERYGKHGHRDCGIAHLFGFDDSRDNGALPYLDADARSYSKS